MKAHVDEDTCIGCGICEATAPNTFKVEGVAKVIEDPVSDEAAAEAACASCPVQAITLDK